MVNLLGRKVLELDNNYNKLKNDYPSFEDYFFKELGNEFEINEESIKSLMEEILVAINSLNSESSDEEVNFIMKNMADKLEKYAHNNSQIDALKVAALYLLYSIKKI